MKTLSRLVVALVVIIIVGGAVFLASWDMPPPSEPVVKVIENDQMFR